MKGINRKHPSGFTIVELLIVIVVIAILAAITILSFNGVQAKSRDSARDSAAKNIRTALEFYKTDNGSYPNACGTANAGCQTSALASFLVPKYLPSIPADPVSTKTIDYVTSASSTSYGLLVQYESKPRCKFLGDTTEMGWWGSSVPACT